MKLFNRTARKIAASQGDLDHPDEQLQNLSWEVGTNLSPKECQQAMLVAQDLKCLQELEILEGGTGKLINSTSPIQIKNELYKKKRRI